MQRPVDRLPLFLILTSFLASPLLALQGQGKDGLGKPLPDPNWLDSSNKPTHQLAVGAVVTAALPGTNFAGMLGVCRDNVLNHFWVSSRKDYNITTTPKGGSPGMIFEFDKNGKFVKAHPQPQSIWYDNSTSPATGSLWGIRDLAAGSGSKAVYIYGSCENTNTSNRVFAFNVVTKTWVTSANYIVPAGIASGTIRALAFDPNGDNGKGSLWTADFSSAITEFNQAGQILRTLNPIAPITAPSSYGAAYDTDRQTVWFFGQGGSTIGTSPTTNPVGCRVVGWELDTKPKVPVLTGSMFFGDTSIPASSTTYPPGGLAGGLDFYIDKQRGPVLLCLAQTQTDTIYQLYGRFQHGPQSGGEIRMHGDAPYAGNSKWAIGLENSKGTAAVLLAGTGSWAAPVSGIFAPGSILRLYIPGGIFVMGSTALTSGAGQLPIAIPNMNQFKGITTYWQWAEVSSGNKIALSSGGFTHHW